MELQVAGLEALKDRAEMALDRIGELQAGTRVQSDAFFSQPFMDDYTAFDSFATFCEQSPWALDDRSDMPELPRDELDEYVASRTDFESWERMKTRAAEEEIIDQIVS